MRDKNKRGKKLQRKRGDFWTELSKLTLPASVSPEKEVPYEKSKKNPKKISFKKKLKKLIN